MPSHGASSGRILVVDDQPANLKAVSGLLSRHGYEVATASEGEQAVEAARAQPPDLLLLDMMMPGMDGFELLAELRRHPELQQLPVIFLTAAQDRELLLRAFAAGAVDYVTKPFIPEELLARVNAHVGLKLTRDRLARVAQERQELVNLVAHDLKNPLSSVLFASEVLQQNACKPERVPRYLTIIHESTRDAIGYIRRYLEAQKQVAAADAAPEHPACVHALVRWLRERYELQLEAHGMRLCIEGDGNDDGETPVAMDTRVLRQVAENLVSNALKYAAEGGELTLAIHPGAGGTWQLRVEDRGPGVAPEKQQDLFRPFTRLGVREDGVSTGLGLSLARQIVLNAGGNLWYEDRDGGGACFVIELPALATA